MDDPRIFKMLFINLLCVNECVNDCVNGWMYGRVSDFGINILCLFSVCCPFLLFFRGNTTRGIDQLPDAFNRTEPGWSDQLPAESDQLDQMDTDAAWMERSSEQDRREITMCGANSA